MKDYSVAMYDLAIVPLREGNPRGGKIENFDDLASARKFAEGQKDSWDMVSVDKNVKDGESKKIEYYQKGRRYDADNK